MENESLNAPTSQEGAADNAPDMTAQPQGPQDIDGLSEFKFQGKSYTPEALAKTFREHQEYSRQAETYRNYDQYLANVNIDIDAVLKDPKLADQFKSIYPKAFHSLLDARLQAHQPAPQANQSQQIPKEVLEKLHGLEGKLSTYERMVHQAEVEKHEAYLQKTVDPLFAKYDYANQDAVYAKAQVLIEEGYQMTPAAWERLIKENHQAIQKAVEAKHEAKIKTQLEQGNKAQDMGAGGSAVANAPRKLRTFNEATEAMLASLKAR